MMRMRAGLFALSLVLAGCAAGPAGTLPARMALGPAVVPQALAAPVVQDWSSAHLVSRAFPAAPAATRHLQALGALSSVPSPGLGKLSSPAYNARKRQVFWITESGWLLRHAVTTGVDTAFPISTTDGPTPTDTFHHTEVTLSKDGARVYLCSDQGRLFALDSQTGKNLINSPTTLGAPTPEVGNFPAPFVDPMASTADGRTETLYAVNNTGTLFRFFVDGTGAVTAPYLAKAETYQMPDLRTSFSDPAERAAVQRFPVSPVVMGGKAFMTVTYRWNDPTSPGPRYPSGYNANVFIFDTLATAPTLAPTTGRLEGTLPLGHDYTNRQPLVVEVGDDMLPRFVFDFEANWVQFAPLDPDGRRSVGFIDTNNLHTDPNGPAEGPYREPEASLEPDGLQTGTFAVDPTRRLVFGLVGNVLYQASYATKTSPDDEPNNARNLRERFYAMRAPTSTWYAKTSLGRSAGILKDDHYIPNHSAPLLVGTDVYVQDNFEDADRSLQTTLNHFTTSLTGAPHLVESFDLTAGAPDGAQSGGLGLCLDPQSGTLFATSNDNDAGTTGRWWAFSR